MEGGLIAVDGSKYAAIFTDEESKQKITITYKKKSEFGGSMTEFLARLYTLPELMVLDSGGENISKQLSFCVCVISSASSLATLRRGSMKRTWPSGQYRLCVMP